MAAIRVTIEGLGFSVIIGCVGFVRVVLASFAQGLACARLL